MDKKTEKKKRKEVIDLTRYIAPSSSKFDPQGMFTGMPNEVFYDDMPTQDVDDL